MAYPEKDEPIPPHRHVWYWWFDQRHGDFRGIECGFTWGRLRECPVHIDDTKILAFLNSHFHGPDDAAPKK